jgi:hypothetical protein
MQSHGSQEDPINMFKFAKRRITVFGVIAALVVASTAYAYWTAGGAGSGSAAAASSTTPLTVNQTTVLTDMYPGDSPQPISGTFDNSNSGPVYVSTVTASIASVTRAGGAVGPCDATDFTLASAAMTVNAEVPAGVAQGAFTGATIQFNNKAGANQDGCKGATVTLAYAIS